MIRPLQSLLDIATLGLLDTKDSLAYRVAEIERHIHSWDRRIGLSAAPSGEVTRAARLANSTTAFVVTSGNNDWGSWLQILGSGDTLIS